MRLRRKSLLPTVPWICRLPPEVLSQIFLRGTQAIGATTPELERDRIYLPIAVSQVCRQWRNTALQLPSLWNYINMQEGRPYDRTILWLKRSRNHVIDIDLDYRNQPPEAYFQRNFLITLNVLIPFIHRWGSLRILAPTSLLETALHVFSAPAPALHTLILKGWRTPEDDMEAEHWSPTIFCKETPRLQNVYLHSIGLKWDACMFEQMRDLTLSWIPDDTVFTVREVARFLSVAAPTLQRLTVIGTKPATPPGASPTKAPTLAQVLPFQVTFPRMAELRLEAMELEDVQTFISIVHAPHLRKLSLSKVIRGPPVHSSQGETLRYFDMWKAAGQWRPDLSRLEHLECADLELDTAGSLFLAICQAARNVRKFTVRGKSSANAILESLTPEPMLMLPEEEALLPKIERLEVHDAHSETVRGFLESRTDRLREVKGSIVNDRRLKKSVVGADAVRQLGWDHNERIKVSINPRSP